MAADKNDKNAKDVNEELHEELHEGFGEVNLGEPGLDLPIDLNEPAADETPVHNPVTPEDLAALAQVEAELNERWNETHIDPTLDRIRELMDLLEQLDGELSTSVGQWDDNARVAYEGAQLQWAASSKRQQEIVQRLVDVAEQS